MRRLSTPVLALVLLAAACGTPEVDPADECGPNVACPEGQECTATTPRRCIQTGSVIPPIPDLDLTITMAGMGLVAVSGQDSCGAPSCSYKVAKDTVVRLTAAPMTGWRFGSWSGDCTGSTSDVTVTVDAARACAATFIEAAQEAFDVTVAGSSGGTVGGGAALVCEGTSCTGKVDTGDPVTFSATASAGHRFDLWRGSSECDGRTENPITVTVSSEIMCRAIFVEVWTVSAATATSGAPVTVQSGACGGASCVVDDGASATFSAGALDGARFTGWTGDEACAKATPSFSLTVKSDVACVAGYARRVSVSGVVGGGLGGAITATSPDAASACAGATCQADSGAAVTLVAPTIEGHRLDGWDGCAGGVVSGAGITIHATADTTCTARYVDGVSVSGTAVGAEGQVTATSSSPGAVCAAGQCALDAGGSVVLTAPELAGYRFTGWSGDPGCAGAALVLTLASVPSSMTCTAGYVGRLTVSGSVAGGLGAVTAISGDARAECGAGRCTVDAGDEVTLTAPAITGRRFTGWTGSGCEGDGAEITVSPTGADVACTAHYVARVRVGATLAGAAGTILFSSDAAYASCDASGCTIDAGDDVTVTAPDLAPDHRFVAWSGPAGCAAITRATEITDVAADVTCTASYVRRVKITAAVEQGVAAPATISSTDPAAVCADGACTVDAGQQVTLTAPVVAGVRFLGWIGGGACEGATDNPLSFAAGEPLTCTASYVTQVTVSASASGAAATVSVSGAGCSGGTSCVVDEGTQVTFTAGAVAGTRFTGWSGDAGCAGTTTPLVLTVTAPTACVASYVARYTVAGKVQDGLTGAVTATSSDGASVCSGAGCTADAGKPVRLVAPAISGMRLTGWSGCTGTAVGNGLTVSATANLTCTATYALGVSVSGTIVGAEGDVTATSTSPGAMCGTGTCVIDQGGSVTLVSEDLAPANRFIGWSSGCSGTSLSVTVSNVTSTVSCIATWVQRLTVTGAMPSGVTGAITATSADPQKSCSGGSCTVDSGQAVTLTAPAVNGFRWTGWTGAGCGTANPMTVTPLASLTCTAAYARTVTVSGTASGGPATVTASSTSAGKACSGASCSLDAGGDVTLSTSDLAPGHRFKGWTGDAGCAATSLVVTLTGVTASKSCDAGWIKRYQVTGRAPSGTVTASSNDPNATCATSSCLVDSGKTVTLSAPAISGYRFTGWSTGCGTDQTTVITPSADLTCDALYVQRYTIAAVAGTGGTVTAKIGSSACSGASCTVDAGTAVTLTASPSSNFQLDGWTGSGCTPGGDNPLVLTSVNATCTASFVRRYTIAAVAGTGGTVSAKTGGVACAGASCTVVAGTNVRLTATADSGHRFDRWTGTGCTPAADNPLILHDVDATCTATFIQQYTIGAAAGTGGTVTAKVGTTTCFGACTVDAGTNVKLTATADSGFRFDRWTGTGCTPAADNPLVLHDVDATCTASFIRQYTIAAVAATGGTVVAKIGTTPCLESICVADAGTNVRLTATADASYRFDKWTGTGCTPDKDNPLVLHDVDATCSATFIRRYTIAAVAGTGGSVTAQTKSTTCTGATCTVDAGTSVTLTATAGASYRFDRWSGTGCTPAADDPLVLQDVDATCTASFVRRYTIAAAAGTGGSVTAAIGPAACPGASCTVDAGVTVVLTATANANFRFDRWTGTGCTPAAGNPLNLKDLDAACTASFIRQYTIAATTSNRGTVTAAAGAATCPGASCTVDAGVTVRLTSTPDSTHHFTGWTGTGCAPADANPLDLEDVDATCNATYDGNQTFTAGGVLSPSTAGTLTASANGVDCMNGGSCTALAGGTTVVFTQTPSPGYVFQGWSSNCGGGTGASLTITVTANITCTASYKLQITGKMDGNGSGSIGATTTDPGSSCTAGAAPVCTVNPGAPVIFQVDPSAGTRVTSWGGPCTVDSTGKKATLASASTPGTCTAHLAIQWAVSLGNPGGGDDSSVAITQPDTATVNILGNATTVPGATIWLPTVNVKSGELVTPHAIHGSLAGGTAKAMLQEGDDAVVLMARSTSPGAPVVARVDPTGTTVFEKALTLTIPGSEVSSNLPVGMVYSGASNLRVGSNLVLQGTAPNQYARLSTISAASGAGSVNVRICNNDQTGGCGACRNTTLGPIAESLGQSGTIAVLNSVPSDGGFNVSFIQDNGAVRWTQHITFGSATATAVAAASLAGGNVVIAGNVTEAQSSSTDGFYLLFKPDGTAGFSGGIYGYTIGRASTGGVLNETLAGVTAASGGRIAMTGAATDSASPLRRLDAWIVVVNAAGAVSSQVAHGGDLMDRGVGIAALSDGYLIAGTTASFGLQSNDLWVLRTSDLDLAFSPSVGGHSRAVGATRGAGPTAKSTTCVNPVATSHSTGNFDVAVDVVDPDTARQAP